MRSEGAVETPNDSKAVVPRGVGVAAPGTRPGIGCAPPPQVPEGIGKNHAFCQCHAGPGMDSRIQRFNNGIRFSYRPPFTHSIGQAAGP